MSELRARDQVLWEQWNKTRSNADLEALIKQLNPVIQQKVNQWASVAPRFLLENEAKALTIKAVSTYRPGASQLSTHVTNHLMKLSRTAYARQSTLAVPEATRLTFNSVNSAKTHLADQLGRPPSLDELADHLRLPPARIQKLLQEVGKRELMESGDGPSFVQHFDDPEVLHLAWHDMPPIQRKVFEMRTGYNGTPVATGAQIMKATNLTQGQLSHQLGKIKTLLDQAQKLR